MRAVRAVFDSWNTPARAGLPARQRHPRRHRHGRQRRPDGVREQGRPLRHRRRLHPQPVHRREGGLRRVPRERPGRGRRRRHPHAATGGVDGPADAGRLRAAARRRCRSSKSTTRTCRTSSSPSRTTSSTCSRPARRSAPRLRGQGGGRDGRGRPDRAATTPSPASTRRSSTSCCTRGSTPTRRPRRSRRA